MDSGGKQKPESEKRTEHTLNGREVGRNLHFTYFDNAESHSSPGHDDLTWGISAVFTSNHLRSFKCISIFQIHSKDRAQFHRLMQPWTRM